MGLQNDAQLRNENQFTVLANYTRNTRMIMPSVCDDADSFIASGKLYMCKSLSYVQIKGFYVIKLHLHFIMLQIVSCIIHLTC